MLSPTDLAHKVGRKVLFIGTETLNWQVADFGKAARNARALGFDTISPKRADGQRKWYQTPGHLALERQAALSEGVGYLPFIYCYGPAISSSQIIAEASIAKEMASVCDGLVCMDLEVEWNNNAGAAGILAGQLRGWSGDVILSTWADPVQQNWLGVIKALDGVVSAWGPQEYTNWLALQEGQFANDGVNLNKLFPSIDVADLFGGANDPLNVMHQAVNKGRGSIWIWEYMTGINNPNLVKSLTALIGSYAPQAAPKPPVIAPQPKPTTPAVSPVPPVKLPSPQHTKNIVWLSYTIGGGETLIGIAAKLGIQNWFQDLFLPNKALLDSVARQHGDASSNSGNLVFPGTVIKYMQMGG